MTVRSADLAIYGGTFDPVHRGHLAIARAVSDHLDTDVCFVPAHRPPHKDRLLTSSTDRLAMLNLALSGQPRFQIDELELLRDEPSYTIDTVADFRSRLGEEARLYFVLGEDAYRSLPSWKAWRDLLNFVHLIVCRRRHKAALSKALSDLEAQRMISSVSALKQAPRGGIFYFQQPEYDVSSTAIRRKLQLDQSLQDDLDPKVYQFVREQRLYLKQDESMSI